MDRAEWPDAPAVGMSICNGLGDLALEALEVWTLVLTQKGFRLLDEPRALWSWI